MLPRPAAPAVLVQRMVEADVSGVAFGADPITGSRSTTLVSAVLGLGTALVGGDADADTYRVDRQGRVLERTIARKDVRHVADAESDAGVRDEPVAPDRADRPALDDAMLLRVAKLTADVGRHFDRPQDIEWAIAGGDLFLLQARPITSLSSLADPEGGRAIWDNSNIAESYAGITTPLTFTFARPAYEGVYREFCRMMRVPAGVMRRNDATACTSRRACAYNLLNWRLLAMLLRLRRQPRVHGADDGRARGSRRRSRPASGRRRGRRQAGRLRLAWRARAGVEPPRPAARCANSAARLNAAAAPPDPPLSDAGMRLDELTAEFRRLERAC